eukprot:825238_1
MDSAEMIMAKPKYFLKFEKTAKRVTGPFDDMDSIFNIFRVKFAKQLTARRLTRANFTANITDREHGERFELDDVDDLYDGARIEFEVEEEEDGGGGPDQEEEAFAESAEVPMDLAEVNSSPEKQPAEVDAEVNAENESLRREVASMKRRLDEANDDKRREKLRRIVNSAGDTGRQEADGRQEEDGGGGGKDGVMLTPAGFPVGVRGLSFEHNEVDLVEFFAGQEIVRGGVFIERDLTGRSTGGAFVTFASEEDRLQGLKRHRKNIGQRYIEVNTQDRRDVFDAMQKMKAMLGLSDLPVRPDTFTVKLKGISWETTHNQIEKFFTQIDEQPYAIHQMLDAAGNFNGTAFVEFLTLDGASDARSLDRKYIGKRYVRVYKTTLEDLKMEMRVKPDPMLARSCCVRMTNILYGCPDEDITRFFQASGIVPFRTHRKKSGGDAFIEFSSPDETDRALKLNKTRMDGRIMNIRRVEYREMAGVVGLPLEPVPKVAQSSGIAVGHPGTMPGITAGQIHPISGRTSIAGQPGIVQQVGGTMQPGIVQSNAVQPGMVQRNMMQAGPTQPGRMQPARGMMQPGQVQPGIMQPGQGQPGIMQPGQVQPRLMQQQMQPSQPGIMRPVTMQSGQMAPGTMQPGMMQPGIMQPGPMQRGRMQPVQMVQTPVMQPQQPSKVMQGGMVGGGRGSRLRIAGMPFTTTVGDIVNFFRGTGLLENSIQFLPNKLGQPSGKAIVAFPTANLARRAQMKLNKNYIGARFVHLRVD